jgi:twinkle protein
MIKQKLEALGIDLKNIKTNGKTLCPKCSHTRAYKKSERCLSVNVEQGKYNCHHCGWSGMVSEDRVVQKKVYSTPQARPNNIGDKVIDYFKERSVSVNTLLRFKITESQEKMPTKSGEFLDRTVICFNYHNVQDQLINIKFRSSTKEFKMNSGSQLIFYGMDVASMQTGPLVVCEGEIDALSFYEAGIRAVSVPNGASKGSMNLEYLDNCWEFFKEEERIILATDDDEPGVALKEELARRLGRNRCRYVMYPEGAKDANEALVKYGKDSLVQMVQGAQEWPLEAVLTASDLNDELDSIYENGYPSGVALGMPELDELIKFMPGQVTVATGVPGAGKTNFFNWISVRLANRYGWKFGVFSPEQSPASVVYISLIESYMGKPYQIIAERYRPYVMNVTEKEIGKKWVNDRFFVMKDEEMEATLDGILSKAEELVQSKGIRGLIIDPWNWVEQHMNHGENETQFTNRAMSQIVRFARKYSVHVFLIAHPRKMYKNRDTQEYDVPTLYDISGSSAFFNKTHNGVVVYRKYSDNSIVIYVQKIKYKWLGKVGDTALNFDILSNNYTAIGTRFESEFEYNKKNQSNDQNSLFNQEDEEAPF